MGYASVFVLTEAPHYFLIQTLGQAAAFSNAALLTTLAECL